MEQLPGKLKGGKHVSKCEKRFFAFCVFLRFVSMCLQQHYNNSWGWAIGSIRGPHQGQSVVHILA